MPIEIKSKDQALKIISSLISECHNMVEYGEDYSIDQDDINTARAALTYLEDNK